MIKKITLSLLLTGLFLVPVLGQAEIYKWKDKNGVMRYSDTPPYTTQKVDTIGKARTKKVRPATETSQPTASQAEAVAKSSKKSLSQSEEAENAEKEAAREQAKIAEEEQKKQREQRKREEEKQQAEIDRKNCNAARANYQTYVQGGRIYETDANGERQYLGDAELAAGKARAQAEINQYCR